MPREQVRAKMSGEPFQQVDGLLEAERRFVSLAEQVATLVEYQPEALNALKKLRSDIRTLTRTTFPEQLRSRALTLLSDFQQRVQRLGYPAWWERDRELLDQQRRTRNHVPVAQQQASDYVSDIDVAKAAERLAVLRTEVEDIADFVRSQTPVLMKLRSKLVKYTRSPWPASVAEPAVALLAEFTDRVLRAGYKAWWEVEEYAVANGNRPMPPHVRRAR